MIPMTHPNGSRFALNADLIERVERGTPTVVVLVDGAHHAVQESLDDVVTLVREYRAAVVAQVRIAEASPPRPDLRIVGGSSG